MTRYRATLAYDGTRYHGFQRQHSAPTVQAEVEQALAHILGQPTRIAGAGRTDSGVHASGQVIAFDAEWAHSNTALLTVINQALPVDISLRQLDVLADFHPRYNALARAYDYSVLVSPVRHPLMIRTTWQVAQPLSLNGMNAAAELLVGRHDFATFGKPPHGDNTVREVFVSAWQRQSTPYGETFIYRIEATAFLHHMVRRIVTMLVAVGRGWQSVDDFHRAFQRADLRAAGKPAPPQGLVLVEVRYPPDDQMLEQNRLRRLRTPLESNDESEGTGDVHHDPERY